MAEFEGPDDLITLARAATIAGLEAATLRHAAQAGRLQAQRPGHDWLTTRRHLHRYLAGRRHPLASPVPPDYPQVEGEEPIVGGA